MRILTPLSKLFKKVEKEENFPLGLELKFNDTYADDNKNAIFTEYINNLKSTSSFLKSVKNVISDKRRFNHNSEVIIIEVGNIKLTDCIYLGLEHGESIAKHYCQVLDPVLQKIQSAIDDINQIIQREEEIIQQT